MQTRVNGPLGLNGGFVESSEGSRRSSLISWLPLNELRLHLADLLVVGTSTRVPRAKTRSLGARRGSLLEKNKWARLAWISRVDSVAPGITGANRFHHFRHRSIFFDFFPLLPNDFSFCRSDETWLLNIYTIVIGTSKTFRLIQSFVWKCPSMVGYILREGARKNGKKMGAPGVVRERIATGISKLRNRWKSNLSAD